MAMLAQVLANMWHALCPYCTRTPNMNMGVVDRRTLDWVFASLAN